MILYSDPMSGDPRVEPATPVVWQSRTVSVMHRLQQYKRQGGRSKQAIAARLKVQNGQHLREKIWDIELEVRAQHKERFLVCQ